MVFGSSHDASHGPGGAAAVVAAEVGRARTPSRPAVKWNEPQLLTPTAPTLRASTFSNDAEPADPGADHRGAGAVDLDVLEVDVRDRVEVLHREVD